MKTKKEITEFYDEYIKYQIETAFNERQCVLFEKMKSLGLNSKSDVLEIGCGIGTVTALVSSVVKKGKITALDISPKSIEVAQERVVNQNNIIFLSEDILTYNFGNYKFDFITLFDVIEHIPMKEHPKLLRKLGRMMKENSLLLINIPHPHSVFFDQLYNPDNLQVIDQAVPADFIVKNAYDANMNLYLFTTHSVWKENDYQFMVFNKQSEFSDKKLSEKRNVAQKAEKKLKKLQIQTFAKKYYRL